MAGETTRLKLIKPAGGELIKVSDLNTNFDTLDNSPGIYICTSTTRPAAPFEGQRIYETDTKVTRVRIGSNWVWMGSAEDWVAAEAWKAELAAGTNGRYARVRFIANDVIAIEAYIRRDDGATYASGAHTGLFRLPVAFRPPNNKPINTLSWVNGAAYLYQGSGGSVGSDGNVTINTGTTTSTGFYINTTYTLV